MDRALLLAELRATSSSAPDFATYAPASRSHLEWLGRAHALVERWRPLEAVSFQIAADNLSFDLVRQANIAKIMNILHRAIADLDMEVGVLPGRAFGPGAVYDVMRALRDLVSSARSEVLIIDPYMDAEVFDRYVSAIAHGVGIRLLLDKLASSLKPAMTAFLTQHSMQVEARKSNELHDRVIFVDRQSCYVVGQSLKDAGKKKATYLAPLSADIVASKLELYEQVWNRAARV